MKGGSVASNAVTGLVSEPGYNSLTKNFSNYTNTGKCGGSATKAKKCSCCVGGKCVKCMNKKKGGNNDTLSTISGAVTRAVSNAMSSSFGKAPSISEGFNVFRSSPAPAGYEYANLRGNASASASKGGAKCTSGSRSCKAVQGKGTRQSKQSKSGGMFAARNMSEYMVNSDSYAIKNRKGGSAAGGLDYGAITHTNKMYGNVGVRETPNAVKIQMASENIGASVGLIKHATYGSATNNTQNFAYSAPARIASGGRKTASKKKVVVVKKVKKVVKKVVKSKK
jgi:hypothetical protein